jgi:hypothetical protein
MLIKLDFERLEESLKLYKGVYEKAVEDSSQGGTKVTQEELDIIMKYASKFELEVLKVREDMVSQLLEKQI